MQLEYRLDGEYRAVVRYDHDGEGITGLAHNVEKERLHVDIYRDGEKVDTEQVTGPLPADEAFNYAEERLMAHLEQYVQGFETWHGIRSPRRTKNSPALGKRSLKHSTRRGL